MLAGVFALPVVANSLVSPKDGAIAEFDKKNGLHRTKGGDLYVYHKAETDLFPHSVACTNTGFIGICQVHVKKGDYTWLVIPPPDKEQKVLFIES